MTPEEQLKKITQALQSAADSKIRAKQEAERNSVFSQMAKYVSLAIQPLTQAVEEIKRIGSSIGILSSRLNNLNIPKPEVNVDLSTLRLPAPIVNVQPNVDLGQIKIPSQMDVKGWVGLMGYDRGFLTNPLPVQLRDASGKPVSFPESLTQIMSGGGGGGGNHVVVDNLSSISIAAGTNTSVSLVNADGNYYNSDNPLPVSFSAVTQQVQQLSGAMDSVNIMQVGGNAVVTGTGYQDNALRTVQATDSISSVSIVSNIAALDVKQVSGSIDSVNLMQTAGNATVVGTGYQDNALRVVNATDAITSTNVTQIGGNAVVVGTGYQDNALRTVQATDSISSVSIVSNIAALDVLQVSGSIFSTNLTQIAGNTAVVGTGYQDNALRVVNATDAITSVYVTGSSGTTMAIGPTVADAPDDGNAPIQMGGIARTSNPTAVSANDVVKATMDDLGRQLIRPIQVRDLIATAYVSVTTGTETTLLAGVAGSYLDCICLMGSNNSDAAVSVDIRAITGGNIVHTLRIPANGTAGWAPHVPWPQDETGNNWTVDGPDETGRTITFSGLFSKEV